jgi:hypothetical protein
MERVISTSFPLSTMNHFEAKRAAQAKRYEELVEKRKRESDVRYKTARSIGSMIPFGQPILVGHHSEGRHRRDLNRIDTNMRKSIEAQEKAEYYAQKAENARNSTTIFSDDPEAVTKLQEKIQASEALRERIKEENATARKEKREQPHPPFVLSNLGQNIGTMKRRLMDLQQRERLETKEEKIGAVTIVRNVEENRVQIFFPGKPDEQIRQNLKSNGFRWSPRHGAWQRHLTSHAVHLARKLVPLSHAST